MSDRFIFVQTCSSLEDGSPLGPFISSQHIKPFRLISFIYLFYKLLFNLLFLRTRFANKVFAFKENTTDRETQTDLEDRAALYMVDSQYRTVIFLSCITTTTTTTTHPHCA